MTSITRRKFLQITAFIAGGAVLACGGGGFAASRRPEIQFPENHYGDSTMAKKILIVYTSKCGSTAEIADSMGKSISEKGYNVDVLPVKKVTGLADYDAVIAGSAIRVGAWLPEAVDFIKENKETLDHLPIGIFTVHALNWENTAASEALRKTYTTAIKQLISPREEAFFTGKIDFSKMTFLEKMMCKAVKAVEEDRRDWTAIRAWAEGVPEKLGL